MHKLMTDQIRGVPLEGLFDALPMALWLEDYSQIYELFEQWRVQGVTDLAKWLSNDPRRVEQCAQAIRIKNVNQKALDLYEADSTHTLMSHISQVMRDETLEGLASEMIQLWEGGETFQSTSVNYTLSGRRMDIVLRGVVLADHAKRWDQVLVVVEDVTELQQARREALVNEQLARGLFEQAPVSLWVEDFSSIKALLDEVREQGIIDFRTFLDVHPEFVERCMAEIRVLEVNGHTLKMFKAKSASELLGRLGHVFDDEMAATFAEQLLDLWEGRLFHHREVRNRTLAGDLLHIHLQFSVLPGHEDDWGLVLLALTDITARKKAEAYLEYLGKHDVLTQVKNRSFYVDELARLARKRTTPVSFIALDLNELKVLNDNFGHAAGDALLRRMGEVLNKVVEQPGSVARIGGDEFMVVLPGMSESEAAKVLADIRRLIDLNNQFYDGATLSVAAGVATAYSRDDYESAVRAADMAMFEEKRRYHAVMPGKSGTEPQL